MNAHETGQVPRIEIAVAVVADEGRFLIGLRGEDGPQRGVWEFPGGKVEPGESPQNAAVRECLEEAGLLVRVADRYPDAIHDYEHGRVHLHFFACVGVEQQEPLPDRFRWVAAADLPRYVFPPANAALIQCLAARPAKTNKPNHTQ
jgi:mutator protein MutT